MYELNVYAYKLSHMCIKLVRTYINSILDAYKVTPYAYVFSLYIYTSMYRLFIYVK